MTINSINQKAIIAGVIYDCNNLTLTETTVSITSTAQANSISGIAHEINSGNSLVIKGLTNI